MPSRNDSRPEPDYLQEVVPQGGTESTISQGPPQEPPKIDVEVQRYGENKPRRSITRGKVIRDEPRTSHAS